MNEDLEDGEVTDSEDEVTGNGDARKNIKGRNLEKMYQKLLKEDPDEQNGGLEEGEDNC